MADGETHTMWGGRFQGGPDAVMEAMNASIDFDRRLATEDIAGSRAHAEMLHAIGALSDEECTAILSGLETIEKEIASGAFPYSRALEDIHMNIEARLEEHIGAPAGKLHMARSRNDQVATDFRLFVRARCDLFDETIAALQRALLGQAEKGVAFVMPGFTHLQNAQPVSWGHHMLAYVEMFARDRGRFADARQRMNECPLGAAALAGTPFPIDRAMTARALGFDRPCANAMDAVSDRDFALEYLAACALCAIHLSRLAEEIILWASAQFAFVRLSDRWSTGSSIMPQKRNPDAAELVRGKAGRPIAALNGLLSVMKGLPLAYAKDMQEDKEHLFAATDALELSLRAMAGMVADMRPDAERMRASAEIGYVTATDLADWLVRERGFPFRKAHHIAGRIVRLAEEKGCALEALPLAHMQRVEPAIDASIFGALGVENALHARTSHGGTAPARVREQIKLWQNRL